ncbi:hypothetical protein EJ04DRAFT_480426 [Polyplosphaeria fusca]|uniref:Zn(2)-C6 fungal-type domain-containing protein n=1 Tax=Polyplosphaeria fusca TaxID=682080 RepID=A0A9P4V9A9_9PLEO|nr:hypothetical protein EJ04DRAFT_480426 [Polyplosphaeria fusca]
MELLGDISFLDALESLNDLPSLDSLTPTVDTPALVPHHGPRPYRSRKNRPCDFCRARKAACKITVAPPCVLCRSYGKECTFDQTTKRKRSIAQPAEDGSPVAQRPRTELDGQDEIIHMETSPRSLTSSHSWSPPTNGHHRMKSSHVELEDWGVFPNGSASHQKLSPTSQHVNAKHSSKPKGFSFALNPTKSAVWVGDTGEADPWLCRRYHYGEKSDDCVLSRITYQRIRPEQNAPRRDGVNESYEEPPLIFMLPDDQLAEKSEPRVEEGTIEETRKEITDLIPDHVGERMLKLFFRFIYPYFPILSREQMLSGDIQAGIRALPLSLLAAIYATTLPFMLYDDYLATAVVHSAPSAVRLYRIAWMGINQEIHTPRLSTLQACLLILQRAPTNRYLMDTPWRWSCTAWTVSLANIMGLCKSSPGLVGLPAWERRLRGRLWWAVYVMDKWSLLGAGMPSHINDDNFDVPEPTLDMRIVSDYSDSGPSSSAGQEHTDLLAVPTHFYHLVQLTVILSDIVKAFYSVRATSQTATNLDLALERAKPLRSRLKDWKEESSVAIAQSDDESTELLDGNASLRLAYIIAVMTLYRALLRAIENTPISTASEHNATAGRAAILAGTKECAKEAVEFAEDLRSRGATGVWDAFWHSWSRSNFALATSFLMRVLVNMNATPSQSREEEVGDVRALIARWRRVLRLMSGNSGNGMTSLALLRLEGDLLQEKSLLKVD